MALWQWNPILPTKVDINRSSNQVTQVSVTSSATAHEKGAWTEVYVTASNARALQFYISGTGLSGSATETLLDIAIGAAGSEIVLISNLLVGYKDALNTGVRTLILPLTLPAGTRISARSQSVVVSKVVSVGVDLYHGAAFPAPSFVPRVTSYGPNTTNSKGVVLTAGASSVEGSWVDITTNTTHKHSGLFFQVQANGRVITAAENWLIDIGVWNGSAYDILWADIPVRYTVAEMVNYVGEFVYPARLSLPAGSRLGARIQSGNANITADIALYGLG